MDHTKDQNQEKNPDIKKSTPDANQNKSTDSADIETSEDLPDTPHDYLIDNEDFFMDYSSVSDVLAKNDIQFPANPIRLSETQTLGTIMAEPIHNNVLLIVDKTEDALPTLFLFEQLYQVVGGKKTPFALQHLSNFISSPENVSFQTDLTKAKGLLNHFTDDVINRKCIPVLTDIIPFLETEELMDEVDNLLSQPQAVICIITKKQLSQFEEIVNEEKEFQRSFASTQIITPKTPLSSFTRMEMHPLSFKETIAILKSYTDQVLAPNGIFSKRAVKSLLKQGYSVFSPENNLIEIQKAFRMLSITRKAKGFQKITSHMVYEFFKDFSVPQESNMVLECESLLNQKILGQSEAIHQISELVQSKEFSLTDEKQPTVLGFFGPSGVGKTATAEALGPILSGKESVLINMSEFQEPHSISKLISSPPGYIGSDQPGLLHKTVSQNPKTVFILDEFEKANPTIHKLFLGIFDKGTAHDTAAGDIDLSQTTMILTSNAGIKEAAGLGFGENSGKISYVADEKEIEHAFAPEFMGRLHGRILFKPLSNDTLSQIIDLTLKPAQNKLSEQFNVHLSLADSARNQLIKEGSNPRYGARPLKNLIKAKILTPIAIKLHRKELGPESSIVVSFDAKQAQYTFEPAQQVIQRHKHIIPLNNRAKTRE